MLAIAAVPWTQTALAQGEETKPGPVEAFDCNYQSGKDMSDLMQVAQRFNKWAEKNDPSYSAWILSPAYGQFSELPDVIWLGSNPSGNEMGKAQTAWRAGGGELQKAFDTVVTCDGHAVASSVEINAPDGPPGDGVVMFTQCSIDDGSDWMKAIAAHKKYATAMRSLGAKGCNWLFFPMIGGSADRDFDYWGVSTFNSWTDYFAGYELYVNGGGWKKGMEALDGAASCPAGSPSVWDVKLVRSGAR